MTTELQTKLERIKEQCREAIELSCKTNAGSAQQGWWVDRLIESESPAASAYIHHARTFSPAAAKALLVAIEALEEIDACHAQSGDVPEDTLELICREWPE